jgi:hypothetical protein
MPRRRTVAPPGPTAATMPAQATGRRRRKRRLRCTTAASRQTTPEIPRGTCSPSTTPAPAAVVPIEVPSRRGERETGRGALIYRNGRLTANRRIAPFPVAVNYAAIAPLAGRIGWASAGQPSADHRVLVARGIDVLQRSRARQAVLLYAAGRHRWAWRPVRSHTRLFRAGVGRYRTGERRTQRKYDCGTE